MVLEQGAFQRGGGPAAMKRGPIGAAVANIGKPAAAFVADRNKPQALLKLIGGANAKPNNAVLRQLEFFKILKEKGVDLGDYRMMASIQTGAFKKIYDNPEKHNTSLEILNERLRRIVDRKFTYPVPMGGGKSAEMRMMSKRKLMTLLGIKSEFALDDMIKPRKGRGGLPGAMRLGMKMGGFPILEDIVLDAPAFMGERFDPHERKGPWHFDLRKDTGFNWSKGFMPSFSPAGEMAASVAAGYKNPVTRGQVRSTSIPGLGNVHYNAQEKVLRSPHLRQPFIVPPRNSNVAAGYANQVQKKFGFNPYKGGLAEGFVPNFAGAPNIDFGAFVNAVTKFGEKVDEFVDAMATTLKGKLNVEVIMSDSIDTSALRGAVQGGVTAAVGEYFKAGPGVNDILALSQETFDQNIFT